MGKNFPNPHGSFDNIKNKLREPKTNGKPSAGITNDSRGNLGPKGPGSAVTRNGKKIS